MTQDLHMLVVTIFYNFAEREDKWVCTRWISPTNPTVEVSFAPLSWGPKRVDSPETPGHLFFPPITTTTTTTTEYYIGEGQGHAISSYC